MLVAGVRPVEPAVEWLERISGGLVTYSFWAEEQGKRDPGAGGSGSGWWLEQCWSWGGAADGGGGGVFDMLIQEKRRSVTLLSYTRRWT